MWLVGGVVRDALLDRPLLDIDVIVMDDCAGAAKAYAEVSGGAPFQLSDKFGCWRVVERIDGALERQVDFCTVRKGALADDLALRDFTINALAVPCWGTPTIVDEHNGLTDLANGVIRTVLDTSFRDDPLRILRAIRFAHTLDMMVHPDTVSLAKTYATLASEPSGERTFAELCALLQAHDSRGALRTADELGVLEVVLPEVTACKGIDQSEFHQFDVFEHTLSVLDHIEDILEEPAHYLGTPGHAPDVPFDSQHVLIAKLAALLHDIGKPATYRRDADRVRFPAHETVGATIVDAICDRWATSNQLRDAIKLLVRTHLVLGFLLHEPVDARVRYRFLRTVEPFAAEAIALSLADRTSLAGRWNKRKWGRHHEALARDLWSAHWHEVGVGLPTPLLNGDEIGEAAGIEPGPQVGTLVRGLAEEQAIGAVTTRDEALAWVSGTASRSPSEAR
jgi:putative nucleotidyltransferase with HDIG domain